MSEWERNPAAGIAARKPSKHWFSRETLVYYADDGEVLIESDDNEDGILVAVYLPAELLADVLSPVRDTGSSETP